MNLFDRSFFRDFVQVSPRVSETRPSKKSHHLIKNAYEFFAQKISEGWNSTGSNKHGFEWAAHIAQILREHMVLVTVISNNEKSANLIFATLNDRGIGLSTVDLIRSLVLQEAPNTHRPEIIECWDAMFNSCGKDLAAETLIRMSWVGQHGDVKSRSLYKIVSEALGDDTTSLAYSQRLRHDATLYRQLRDADTDDGEVQENLIALRTLKFNACYPLLFSAERQLNQEENKKLINALVTLVIRHNIVCGLDRAKLESTVYETAKMLSDGGDYELALRALQNISPSTTQFSESFEKLAFSKSDHSIARYLLTCFDSEMATTQEVTVAGANCVHIEHIYPQSPLPQNVWENHDHYVRLIGNMTLLDKRLNESIKNADFQTKKADAYVDSRLEVTKALLQYDSWSPEQIALRQTMFCQLAQIIWPATLI
jgi:hypothetical protein